MQNTVENKYCLVKFSSCGLRLFIYTTAVVYEECELVEKGNIFLVHVLLPLLS